ncbi:hypothetical protein GDO81_009790 [Engystomops pustulosus]|uniref:Little elongation complex subunit 2 C-terminal domain-containing protein n=1 Tax=Engystomops pustulosus TaxID=76066 RepID=A0AAV7BU18_ENGPU|nr:hypothetical protein GDO81_009790 [Engystomops pustulosus]
MIKFLNKRDTNVSFGQVKEYNHYQFLKSKSICEVPEFQKFLQNAARSCAEDYNLLCADADLYVTKLIESCQMYVKNYPPLYTVHEITSILGGKFVPDLTFNLEKCLLQMGSVKLVKVKFPSDEIPLPTMYKKVIQMLSPKKKADRIQENVTLDPNISKLVPKYCPQVVLTSQALFTLLNNHAPGFSEQWEIPLCVRTMDGKGVKSYFHLDSFNVFNQIPLFSLYSLLIFSSASHQDGSYLLSHVSGDSSVYLYKSTKDQQRGAYNLHEAHCNPPKAPSSLSVPWVPLNPNLLLKYHIQHGRPPCTFPPVPEMDAGINKEEEWVGGH